MDGIKMTLKELYDEKAERQRKQEERERKLAQKRNNKKADMGDFDGFDRGYGSSPSENTRNVKEDEETKNEITSEEQRYLKF